MSRAAALFVASSLTAAMVGCGAATDSTPPQTQGASTTPSEASSDLTLVTLSVPNMT
jgi:hypothetical protein